jgi:hypothetical protein
MLKLPWIRSVGKLLDSLGLTNYWINNDATSLPLFKKIVKNRLKDQFIRYWHSEMSELSKCLNY